MSSLLSKLKTLIQAGARRPRRRQKAPGQAQTAAQTAAQKPGHVPEVTEASAQQRARAEVTEASPAQVAQSQTAAREPAHDLAEPGPEEAHSGELEEERVVDILKGKQT